MKKTSETLCVVTPKRLLRHILFSIVAGGSLCIHGGAGVGKSEIVNGYGKKAEVKRLIWEEWAKKTGREIPKGPDGQLLDIRVVHYTIPQMSEESFEGVPRHIHLEGDDWATTAAPVLELRPRDGYPIILFLDEVKAADTRVQKVLLQLVLEKKIHNVSLPAGTLVVMATNRAEDQAALKKMPFPLANRAWHGELGVSADDWLSEFAEPNNIHYLFRAYVREKREAALLGYDPESSSDVQLTPRSYTDAARRYAAGECLGGMDDLEIEETVYGCIGKGKGIELVTWLKLRDKLPTFEEICEKGGNAKLPGYGETSECYYAASMILENLRKKQSPDAMKNVIGYLEAFITQRTEVIDAIGWICGEIADRASGEKAKTQAEADIALQVLNAAAESEVVYSRVTEFLERIGSKPMARG